MDFSLPSLPEIIIALIGVLAWRHYEKIIHQKESD